MTTHIISESKTPERTILAERITGPIHTWKPYRVKITETHFFKDEQSCLEYFHLIRSRKQETP